MQGKLQEIDIRSILQLLELGQRTGELFVEASPSSYWFVFFLNGHIIYASDTEGSIIRLRDYLRRYKADEALNQVPVPPKAAINNAPEYNRLWSLLEHHKIDTAQGKQILLGMVREVLFDLLSLHHGSFIFEAGSPLAPQLTTFVVEPLLTEIVTQVQEWKKLHPYIQSPDQAPTILNSAPLKQTLPEPVFKALQQWSDGKTSLRQMGRYLGRDMVAVAKALYPYVRQGAIQLSNPPIEYDARPGRGVNAGDRPPHILCIDDSMAIQKTVEFILQNAGYQVTTIGNPLKALGQVFLLNPDMILCDVAMPKLDGYELCAMLRKSSVFRQIPMIMLTGKDGFTDRIKARMAGANEYLTKPFAEKELLTIVESYVGLPPKLGASPNRISTPS